MADKLKGEIELADGETVEIPRPDKIYPTFGRVQGSCDARIEDGRFRIRDESPAEISLAGVNSDFDVRETSGPVATIHANHKTGDDDEVYAEMAFDDVDMVKELRDSLTLLLRYWGENDE